MGSIRSSMNVKGPRFGKKDSGDEIDDQVENLEEGSQFVFDSDETPQIKSKKLAVSFVIKEREMRF